MSIRMSNSVGLGGGPGWWRGVRAGCCLVGILLAAVRVQGAGPAVTSIGDEGADVVVPNGTLLSEKFTNWTLRDQHRRLDIEIGVAYGADPDRVSALLLEVVAGTEGVVDVPAPTVLFSGFGASSLDFSVRGWTHDFDNWPSIRSAVATRLYAALVKAGIEIPFPQQDLHLRSVSEEVARSLRATPPATPGDDRASPLQEPPKA